jgi:hypothetical protein
MNLFISEFRMDDPEQIHANCEQQHEEEERNRLAAAADDYCQQLKELQSSKENERKYRHLIVYLLLTKTEIGQISKDRAKPKLAI